MSTKSNGDVECALNYKNQSNGVFKLVLKMTWKGEKLKKLNRVETDKGGHEALDLWLKADACNTRVQGESGAGKYAERECHVDKIQPCGWLRLAG
ncbi:hypothetical protein L195_g038096 [Trifolium pratense]|uniref:Uncharacterized protein n=1 Tax=Trifolium pratense TaxID=57577 RepID=A0A2K3LU84_TRIPR|nr:hypothetical protein L195_g038096 [Trifolium pratense]